MGKTVIVETRKRGNPRLRNDNGYNAQQYSYLVVGPAKSSARKWTLLFLGLAWSMSSAAFQYLGWGWLAWESYSSVVIVWSQLFISLAPAVCFAGFVYVVIFDHKKEYYREDYVAWLENADIIEETTTETVEDDTSALNYQMGTNADNSMLVNQHVMSKYEEPATVDGMEFSSGQMAFLRRLAIHDNHISRDEEWEAMNRAGLIEGDYKKHFKLARALFERKKWIANNRWTPRAYEQFLKVNSPYPDNEISESRDFSRGDGDDDEGSA